MGESDPNGLTAHTPGAKMDSGKAPVTRGVLHYFARALEAISKVSAKGAEKYAWNGWESVPDGFTRYSDALGRHFLKEAYEEVDIDTGCLHAEQVAWNALARLELKLRQREASTAAAYDSNRRAIPSFFKEATSYTIFSEGVEDLADYDAIAQRNMEALIASSNTRLRFKIGDRVKVIRGVNTGQRGEIKEIRKNCYGVDCPEFYCICIEAELEPCV